MTQPRGPAACTVTPPPRDAGHEITRPLVVTTTCFPAIAMRTCRGTKPSPTDTVDPRAAVAVFFDDENGAPQCAFQHHDDFTRGTVPAAVESDARGGPASTSAAISATTKKEFATRGKNHPSSAKPDVESAASEGEPETSSAGSCVNGCSPVNHA